METLQANLEAKEEKIRLLETQNLETKRSMHSKWETESERIIALLEENKKRKEIASTLLIS